MKRLLIAGAGGFGREVCEWAAQSPDHGRVWRIGGFLDDNPLALNGFSGLPPVVGPIRGFAPGPEDVFVCAVGRPKVKRQVVGELLSRGASFVSLIHPSVVLGRQVSMGGGVILCPFVTVTCDVSLGDFVTINIASSVGHDASIGSWSTLSGHCDITGHAELGEEVFLGSRASVLPKVKVGDRAVIGAGAIALLNVPPDGTLAPRPSFLLA